MKIFSDITKITFDNLLQKTMDSEFDSQFSENGNFYKSKYRNKEYWYYKGYNPINKKQNKIYVGSVNDKEITKRIENFGNLKIAYSHRKDLVSKLIFDGLPQPNKMEGEILNALSKSGIFRLRATLIGSVAYQTYSAILNVKLDNSLFRTDDIDIAKYYGISIQIDDQTDNIEDCLKQIDKTFEPIFDPDTPKLCSGFKNSIGYKIEFLTPNRGDEKYSQNLSEMPSLNKNIGAQPTRYLDLLIRNPMRGLILYGGGIVINVPSPERYAIHKLIVSVSRTVTSSANKSEKDIKQVGELIETMFNINKGEDIGLIWIEAFQRGNRWQKKLLSGALKLPETQLDCLIKSIQKACQLENIDSNNVGIGKNKKDIIKNLSKYQSNNSNYNC